MNELTKLITAHWLTAALLFAFAALFIIFYYLYKRLLTKSQQSQDSWYAVVLKAFYTPIKYALLLTYIFIVSYYLDYQPTWLKQSIYVVIALFMMWSMLRLVSALETQWLQKIDGKQSNNLILSTRIARITVVVLTVMIVSQSVGFSIAPLLTVGGIGGLVVGLAAKDLLSNIFGGLMLQIDKPFSVGDWIRVTERNLEGVVERIGWRMTRIRTFSKNPVYVPNAIFSAQPIETPSRMDNRRIKETIGLRYQDLPLMKTITKEVEAMLKTHQGIDQGQAIMVCFNQFSVYSIDFIVYCFTKTKEWQVFQKTKEDVLFQVAEIIEKNKGEIAFPTRINIAQTEQKSA